MSPELMAIPRNTVVYIDANIFIYAATGHSNYRLTIIELAEKEGVEPRAVIRLIKENPSVLAKASSSFAFIERMLELTNLDFAVYTREIAFLAETVAKKYFLMSNDATHVATMKMHGIRDIATNDPDFERVEGINIWKP